MQFRDLKKQYQILKEDIDEAIWRVLMDGNYISGYQVEELENELAEYVGTKYCISCGNGTDALSLALMAWNVGIGDAVFVPDFTFFASGETPAYRGAVPVFVDVEKDTFNISPISLEHAIIKVKEEGTLNPKVIIAVDLFGQPADYPEIRKIADKYNLLILEDGAQGFGGRIGKQRACSFGDISTTSFFPAKPLGCYGDGGAVFTDHEDLAKLLRSYHVHGKGKDKYDNVRIGVNSRLDTLQAAILQVKLQAFKKYELNAVNQAAERYTQGLKELVQTPEIKKGFYSSWAQYSILLQDEGTRNSLQSYLKEKGIPTMIYYSKQMCCQAAFQESDCIKVELPVSRQLCRQILSLPLHPYIKPDEQEQVIACINEFLNAA